MTEQPPDLWGQRMRIPILMLSGEVNSGKTLFGLGIDPNCRKPAAEAEPTTIVWDQEGSAEPYAGGLNFTWKDTRAAVAAGVHMEQVAATAKDPRWLKILKENADCNDSPAASMFRAWYMSLIKVPAKRYSVGMVDTFTPLQDGMIDWLKRHPEAFGRTAEEYRKLATMTLWPDVKAMLSHILSVDCRLRFEAFVLTVHLKNEWEQKQKTGLRIAEGLDVLQKLATVHFELDRSPKAKGKDAPKQPAGLVRKERMIVFGATPEDDRPVLPPRMPECTPHAIRQYILNPPDFAKLKLAERAPDDALTDDQKLLVNQQIAQNEAETATAKLSALEMARQAAATMAQQNTQYTATMSPTSRQRDKIREHAPPSITPRQLDEIMGLVRKLFATGAGAGEWLQLVAKTPDPTKLTESQAEDVIVQLYAKAAHAAVPPHPGASPDPEHQAAEQQPAPTEQPTATDRATQEQREKIRDLTVRLYGEHAIPQNTLFLQSLGYGSANSLTVAQAASRIQQLRDGFEGEPPF